MVVAATKDVRKVITKSKMLADDIVLCVDEKTYMAEYSEAWMRALEHKVTRTNRPTTEFMDFKVGHKMIKGESRQKIKGKIWKGCITKS